MSDMNRTGPDRAEAFAAFGRIGLLSFGGPAAQISLMHRVLVDEKGWLTEKQYLNALSFCMLLPGPEAMQLATYAGWRLHGVAGGLMAGLLFVLPGAAVVLTLAVIYAIWGSVPLVSALFLGVKAAVLIIVIEALLKVSRRALKGTSHWIIAGLAFIAIFFLALPFPLIIGLAAQYGFIFAGRERGDAAVPVSVRPLRTLGTVLVWLIIWLVPLLLIGQLSGFPVLGEIGLFFSKLAVVTFGGAYAVLAYMAQDVVTGFGWLTAVEMMDGLGLAETTPGPLILVTEFVGFIAAFREGGIGLGLAGALVTLWATFAPCFLWIFTGAPYIEWISAQPRLSGALAAITAAVVGVILNLSIWFGLHVLFRTVTLEQVGPLTLWQPELGTLDPAVLTLSIIAAVLLLNLHWSLFRVLAFSALGGLLLSSAV
ncbi:chromate efflux transporter [Minwuia sp.]|uniref:chromate efflux transporter n=1 Tax=Minwuia sp. TaxID=2493630 RepID=UPI003A951A13